jgi:hypothetical protein
MEDKNSGIGPKIMQVAAVNYTDIIHAIRERSINDMFFLTI